MAVHSFNVEIANKYGMLEAVLLNHLWYWCEYNRKNEKNFFENAYWTYGSASELAEIFPYASKTTIFRSLKNLVAVGIIKDGNFNTVKYDKTKWYSFTEKGAEIMSGAIDMSADPSEVTEENELTTVQNETSIVQNESSMLPKCNIDVAKMNHRCYQNGTTIPDIKTNNKTDNKTDIREQEIVRAYNEICTSLPKCAKLTDARSKKIKARLKEFSFDQIKECFRKAAESDFISRSERRWCNLDWMIHSEDNMQRILEGKYDNAKPQKKGFTNFPQREYDYGGLEKRLLQGSS